MSKLPSVFLLAALIATAAAATPAAAQNASSGQQKFPEIFAAQKDAPMQVVLPGSRKPIIVPAVPAAGPENSDAAAAAPTTEAAAGPPAPPAGGGDATPHYPDPPARVIRPIDRGIHIAAVVDNRLVVTVDGATHYLAAGDTLTYGDTVYKAVDARKGEMLVPIKGPGPAIRFRIEDGGVEARGPAR